MLLLALLLPVTIIGQALNPTDLDYLYQAFCFVPCSPETLYTGQEWIPGTDCEKYHNCFLGKPTSWAQCGAGLRFDPVRKFCESASLVQCPMLEGCPPTMSPTFPPSPSPSMVPSTEPTRYPTLTPTVPPESIARDYIKSKRDLIEKKVLVSYTNSGVAFPSNRYKFDGLMDALDLMAVKGFGADFQFNLWDGTSYEWKKGIINLSAFLANAMVESIQYDSCDENNWEGLNGRYAISNSCGQEGYSYQDEECSLEFQSSCPVLSTMEVTAVTGPIGDSSDRLPPPLSCKPGAENAGYWDSNVGIIVTNAPYTNAAGRKDTQGCCWWGRGSLQTRGPCSIGKINFYLGKKGAEMGRKVIYPQIDFCAFPEAICAAADDNLRWNAGLFEWAERIQRYDADDWNYMNELEQFVAGGLISESFITSVSRIVSRKCHKQGCSDVEARMLDKRIENFFMIINDIFELRQLFATPNPTSRPTPTPDPTRRPTPRPLDPPVPPPAMEPSSEIQKTNQSPSVSAPAPVYSPIKDESVTIISEVWQSYQPTDDLDGLIKLEGNTGVRIAPLLITGALLAQYLLQ